jgi:PAS domain S-box-containing protein
VSPEQNDPTDNPPDFQFLADSIPQLVWVTGPDGNPTYFNQSWYAYTGLSPAQSRDEGWRLALHPDDYHGARSARQDARAAGQPYQLRYRLRRYDGAYRWFLGGPCPAGMGRGKCLGGTGPVLTSRTRSGPGSNSGSARPANGPPRRARRQKDRAERFFRQAPAAICVLDGPELVFELVNPAFAQLYPGRELLGKSVREALPEIARGPFYPVLQQVYQTGQTFEGKEVPFPLARYAGGPVEDVYFNFTYQARLDEQGAVDGILAFGHEVTDQVLARRQARKASNNWRCSPGPFLNCSGRPRPKGTSITAMSSGMPIRGWTSGS